MGATPIQDDRFVWLDGGCHGRELVGGKGASLSQLFSLGAPVPARDHLHDPRLSRHGRSL